MMDDLDDPSQIKCASDYQVINHLMESFQDWTHITFAPVIHENVPNTLRDVIVQSIDTDHEVVLLSRRGIEDEGSDKKESQKKGPKINDPVDPHDEARRKIIEEGFEQIAGQQKGRPPGWQCRADASNLRRIIN